MKKRRIDLLTLSPLLLLILLPLGAFFGIYFTTTAAHPEIALHKYFSIPLIGFSIGCVIFLGIARNNWRLPYALSSFIERYSNRIILIISLIFLICFTTLAILRYTSFHTSILDMGIFDKKIWRISTASLSAFFYEISLGHFQPLLILHGIIYKFIDSPVIIQGLQSLVTISGVIPIYLITRRQFNHAGIIILIVGCYLLYPPVGFNSTLDFHADHLYIPLILWAYYFAEKDKYITAITFAGIGAMAKEPLILGAAFFGLYIALAKKQYKIGIAAFVFFLLLFFIIIYIALPHFNQTPAFSGGTFPFLEDNNSGKLTTLINSLINTLLMWKVRKMLFVYFLLAPLLFLPLLEWKRFLPAIPLIAIPLLSTSYLHASIDSQYTAGIIAPAFVALVFSIKKIEEWRGIKYANAFASFVVIMTITFHIAHGASPIYFSFWKDGWAEIWHRSNYTYSEHEKAIETGIFKIPKETDKIVTSQNSINHARLAHRYKHWVFPYQWEEADYILLDIKRPLMIYDHVDEKMYMEELRKIKQSPDFQPEFEKDGVLLFKRAMKGTTS